MNPEISSGDLRERITLLMSGEEPFRWAKRLGIPQATWDRFWNGGAIPKVQTLHRIVQQTGASMDWLLYGAEVAPSRRSVAAPAAIDDELMGRVTDSIVRLYKDERVSLAPIDLGRLSARKYAEIVAATDDAQERLAMIKLVVTQLRADLRAAAAEPGTGKASA